MLHTICIERKDKGKLTLDKDTPWSQHEIDKAVALPQVQKFLAHEPVNAAQLSNELRALSDSGARGQFKGVFKQEITREDTPETMV